MRDPIIFKPNALDFSPMSDAIGSWQAIQFKTADQEAQKRKLEMEQSRLGMEQTRLGFEQELQPYRIGAARENVEAIKNENYRKFATEWFNAGEAGLSERDPARKSQYHSMVLSDKRFGPEIRSALGADANDPDKVFTFMNQKGRSVIDQYGLQEKRLGVAKAAEDYRHATTINPIKEQQAGRKDSIDAFIESIIGGGSQQPAQAQPGYKPMSTGPGSLESPAYLRDIKDEASLPPGTVYHTPDTVQRGLPPKTAPELRDPNIVLTQAGPAQQQPQQAPPAQKSPREIIASRSPAEQAAFALTLKKDPAKAGEMLRQWGEPDTAPKAVMDDIAKNEMNALEAQSSLRRMRENTKPEFLQPQHRANMEIAAMRAKYGTGKMQPSPTEMKALQEYSTWRATSWQYVNAKIKAMSGSAVAEHEMKRMLVAEPNPGTGIFDGDAPPVFAAKLDETLRNADLAIARMRYLRNQGFKGDVNAMAQRLPLDRVEQEMDRRGEELLKKMELNNPGTSRQQLLPQVRQQLKQEFGI